MDDFGFLSKKIKTRRRGFYFWTMKKNFLSLHYTRLLLDQKRTTLSPKEIANLFLRVFKATMDAIRAENDLSRREKVRHLWARTFGTVDRCSVPFGKIRWFLYLNRISAEELHVYYDADRRNDPRDLWAQTLLGFSTSTEVIDDENSHCSKMYTTRVWFPRSCVDAGPSLERAWGWIVAETRDPDLWRRTLL